MDNGNENLSGIAPDGEFSSFFSTTAIRVVHRSDRTNSIVGPTHDYCFPTSGQPSMFRASSRTNIFSDHGYPWPVDHPIFPRRQPDRPDSWQKGHRWAHLSMYFYLAVTSLVVSAGIRFPGVPYYYRAQTAQYTYRISIPADWHSDVDA